MKSTQYSVAACLVACAALTTACGDINLTPFLDNLFSRQVAGTVTDDAAALPTGSPSRVPTPIAGVWIEVAAGPDQGRFAISAANGSFDLGVISTSYGIRATLAGWDSYEGSVVALGNPAIIALGRAPHVLWGTVYVTGPVLPVSGVRVEILNGPNAGQVAMTSETGLYRFDDMATQGRVDFEFSKAGYRTERTFESELRRNTSKTWYLTPQ